MLRENFNGSGFVLRRVAGTNDVVSDFKPYVASINDAGVVAFQASLSGGASGVFTTDGSGAPAMAHGRDSGVLSVVSHPDINGNGWLSFYGNGPGGEQGVFVVRDDETVLVARTSGDVAGIGPLGPTMNDEGTVAFRGQLKSGGNALFVSSPGEPICIAESGPRFVGFEGLPVITSEGAVVFRANRQDGGEGIYRWEAGETRTLVETGDLFRGLGRFPWAGQDGSAVFCANLDGGRMGVFRFKDEEILTVVETGDVFESVRGALADRTGRIVFYATPRGEQLGIYAGPDPAEDKILAVGDSLFGATVTEFVLNPVSINAAGCLAIRVAFADGAQGIVRAEPRA